MLLRAFRNIFESDTLSINGENRVSFGTQKGALLVKESTILFISYVRRHQAEVIAET